MTEGERLALGFFEQGIIRIDEEGRVWRMQERRKNRPYLPCDPPRLTGTPDDRGYSRFSFTQDGKPYRVLVNRLVYLATHGTIDDSLDVDHIDFDRTNNRPGNLQQLNHLDNVLKSTLGGRYKARRAPKAEYVERLRAQRQFTPEQVREIRRRSETERLTKLAKEFGCHICTVSDIRQRRAYAWVQ